MPIEAKKLPFFEHFAELRRRATICIAVVFVLCVAFYLEAPNEFITNVLFGPIRPFMPAAHQKLAVTGPFEAMTFRFQIGALGALVVASPLILYHIFAFFAPALKERERKWVFPTVAAAVILFLGGVAFAYFFIAPAAFEWLAEQNTSMITQLPMAQQWLSGVGMILLGFGLSFELPLVVFYVVGFGILSYRIVRESWRVAYVGITVLAAIATPDWSPYPMLGLSLALILLFEGSLFAARIVFKHRIDQQYVDAYDEMLMYDNEPTDDKETLKKRAKLTAQAEAARKRLAAHEVEKEAAERDSEKGKDN